jgi:hypothetical protein
VIRWFGEEPRGSRGKFAVTRFGEEALGRSDNVGKQDGRDECDNREEHKGQGAKPADSVEGVVGAPQFG